MPLGPFGKHHPICEDGAFVEDAIPIRIGKPYDPMRPFLELLLERRIRP